MDPTDRIFVAGHRGMVGSAIVRRLQADGFRDIVVRTRQELDLCDQAATFRFFAEVRPTIAVIAAARVGGIHANNTYRFDFIHENLAVASNTVEGARRAGVRRLLFLGSSCIYPRMALQPMKEEYLLTSPLEPTNEPYAVAKIAGLKLIESCNRQHGTDWISAMPTNLYGPGDNYHPDNSHVLPGLLRRFHQAKVAGQAPVTCWGTGSALREFLHVDDLAAGCVHALRHFHAGQIPGDFINIGSGSEIAIRDLALLVQRVTGHTGALHWDSTKPDGTPRKLMDSSRMAALGWRPRIALEDGVRATYQDLLAKGVFAAS